MDTSWGESFRFWAEKSLRSFQEPPLWIIEKLAIVSSRLDPSVDTDKVMKKVRFLYYDLTTFLGDASQTDLEKLTRLRDYFFREKEFQCRPQTAPAQEEDYLIHSVMNRRYGSPLTIGLLFRSLAQYIHLQVDLVVHENLRLVKFVQDGHSRYLDIVRQGEFLTKEEILDLLSRESASHQSLENLGSEQILLNYLMGLRRVYKNEEANDKLMNILNLILNLQSSNLKVLAERALLKDRLGQPYEALLDLKRYFAFYDEQQSPHELVEKYHRLKAQFGTLSRFRPPFK